MCGIFASTRPDIWRALSDDVLARLDHRGPDANGSWESPDGAVLVCHTRLSILGLGPEGAQPAVLPTGEALSYNGEIYNFADLAGGLGDEAARSDTQVILRTLARDGVTAVNAYRGMYAFAYWDPNARTLTAARDPWGIKPLYVLRHPTGGITLSSEIGPLLLHPDGRQVDPIGIAQYVAFGHTVPEFTTYSNITKLDPGHVYSWEVTSTGCREPAIHAINQTVPAGADSIAEAIDDSVRAHLTADVEVGVFLSGGIDSTLIASLARVRVPDLHAFTLSFPDAPSMDESDLAAANAAVMGIRHTIVPVTATEMLDSLDKLLDSTGEPFGDPAALPLLCLSLEAAKALKVVLTGEGADELFGGYGRYRISRLIPPDRTPGIGSLTGRVGDAVYERRSDRPRSRAIEALARYQGGRSHAALLGADLPALGTARGDPGRAVAAQLDVDWHRWRGDSAGRVAARRFDLHRWLPNTYLEKTDRATMAASLEARTPFLDPVVAKAALRPDRQFGKDDLRRQLVQSLPEVRLPDRKKGLAVPIDTMLSSSLGDDLARVLGSHQSVLYRTLGHDVTAALRARSARSLTTAYRLAVLGRWESRGDLSI